jgi:hypothetical protein
VLRAAGIPQAEHSRYEHFVRGLLLISRRRLWVKPDAPEARFLIEHWQRRGLLVSTLKRLSALLLPAPSPAV